MTEQPWALMSMPPGAAAFLGVGLGEPPSSGARASSPWVRGRQGQKLSLFKMLIFVLCGLFLHSF